MPEICDRHLSGLDAECLDMSNLRQTLSRNCCSGCIARRLLRRTPHCTLSFGCVHFLVCVTCNRSRGR